MGRWLVDEEPVAQDATTKTIVSALESFWAVSRDHSGLYTEIRTIFGSDVYDQLFRTRRSGVRYADFKTAKDAAKTLAVFFPSLLRYCDFHNVRSKVSKDAWLNLAASKADKPDKDSPLSDRKCIDSGINTIYLDEAALLQFQEWVMAEIASVPSSHEQKRTSLPAMLLTLPNWFADPIEGVLAARGLDGLLNWKAICVGAKIANFL